MVRRNIRCADKTVDRRKIYDAAAACLHQMGDCVFGAEKYTLHVHRLHLVPFGFRDFVRRLVDAGDSRIVHDNIEPTEVPNNIADRLCHLGFPRDVAVPELRRKPPAQKLAFQFAAFLVEYIEERHFGPLLRHADRSRASEAKACAGHDCYFSLQSVHFNLTLMSNEHREVAGLQHVACRAAEHEFAGPAVAITAHYKQAGTGTHSRIDKTLTDVIARRKATNFGLDAVPAE